MSRYSKTKRILAIALTIASAIQATGSEVKDVLPLTNQILVVHFNDGYAIHHKKGQLRTDESIVATPLDEAKAMALSSYALKSSDDANYQNAPTPVGISRKSKGTSFAWICESYNNGCVNTSPDYAKEHWIYLFLPQPMISGKTYTLQLGGLAATVNTFTILYDEKWLHSDAVHVNNIGYSTAATQKYGYVYHWMGSKGPLDLASFDRKPFHLIDSASRNTVYSGVLQFRKSKTNPETGQAGDTPGNNFSGANVYECDFSAFNTPGTYFLEVDGMGSSFPFSIGADVFREPFYWTMKGLYQNRSGIELLPAHTEKPRPAPHHPGLTPGFEGRLKYTATRYFDLTNSDSDPADKLAIEKGYKGTLNSYGWYQDAGDWDTYFTHSHVAANLMFLYEAGRNKFTDNELHIPESGNGIPDLLDEAAWQLRFYKRTKDEILSKGWGTGGVAGARVMGDLWGSDVRADGTTKGSWEDTDRDWYVSGEDPWATYKYAALAAQMDFILRSERLVDSNGVDWRKEAIDAYNWAKNHTQPGDETEKFGFQLRYIRMYAAGALYRLTNLAAYHDDYKAIAQNVVGSELDQAYPDLVFGAWIYLLMPVNRQSDPALLAKIKASVTTATENQVMASATARACRWGGNFNFPMLIGQPTTPMVAMGIFGYLANKDDHPARAAEYLAALHTTSDYFLGCNPLNMTWISGVGERNPTGIFHLDWWYSGNPNVIKGVVPYGPWKVEDLGPLGPWNPNWAYADKNGHPRIYPVNISDWPGHERWFDQRSSPLSCEFTIHQNTVLAAIVYGFLTKDQVSKTIYMVDTYTDIAVAGLTDKGISVYPNPAQNKALVEWNESAGINRYEIFDSTGAVPFSGVIEASQKSLLLNTGKWTTGTYIIRLYSSQGRVMSVKLIIAR